MKRFIKTLLGLFYCRIAGVRYSKGVYVGLGSKLVGGAKIKLSKGVKIMPQAMLVTLGKGIIEIVEDSEISMYSRVASLGFVKIGRSVLTGPHIFIADFNHEFSNPEIPIMNQGNRFVPKDNGEPNVWIEDGAWIGTNVVIVGNVHIGKNAVVGANSVVTHDIPAYSVAVGSPCRVIKQYDFDKKCWVKF